MRGKVKYGFHSLTFSRIFSTPSSYPTTIFPPHLLHQRPGDGEAEAGGAPGGFHGEKSVEELSHLNLVQVSGVIGKGKLAVLFLTPPSGRRRCT